MSLPLIPRAGRLACALAWTALLAVGCGDDAGSNALPADVPMPSSGCEGGDLDASVRRVELAFGGATRDYELHVPTGYDPSTPTPLVLNFHGFGSNALEQAVFSAMNPTADAEGFLVAYPNGLDDSWNGGVCCGESAANDVDDVGFARAVIDDLGARGCVDLSRVYATGMSNGGFLSHRLACDASDVIAAIAPVAGVLGIPAAECQPARPVPVIHFHGTEDPLVAYEGGLPSGAGSVADTIELWSDRDGCAGEPEITFHRGVATCETRSECDAGTSVTLCTIDGGEHCWPGQAFCPPVFGTSTTDIDARAAMWDLFRRTRLPR